MKCLPKTLYHLDISFNILSSVSLNFGAYVGLCISFLNISGNNVQSFGVLAEILKKMPVLKILIADSCHLLGAKSGGFAFLESLESSNLKKLSIRSNFFDAELPFKYFCSHNVQISELDVANNVISNFDDLILLQRLIFLEVLCLADMNFGDEGARLLSKLLTLSKIQKLDVSFCSIGDEGMEQLLSNLLCSSPLYWLSVSGNPGNVAPLVSSILTRELKIQHLNLSGCALFEDSLSYLSTIKSLTTLILCDCSLDLKCIQPLLSVFKSDSIEFVDVRFNSFDKEQLEVKAFLNLRLYLKIGLKLKKNPDIWGMLKVLEFLKSIVVASSNYMSRSQC
jgi:hypothetical protein